MVEAGHQISVVPRATSLSLSSNSCAAHGSVGPQQIVRRPRREQVSRRRLLRRLLPPAQSHFWLLHYNFNGTHASSNCIAKKTSASKSKPWSENSMRIAQQEINNLLPYRARGLNELAKRAGHITPLIESRLKKQRTIRILESGCGFGAVLMELRKAYGDRVELHGINKTPKDGDWKVMQEVALQLGIFAKKELRNATPPELLFHDVSRGLPYPSNSFDIIFSQVSFMYYEDKIHFLEETNRALKKDGIAKIDLCLNRPEAPPEYELGLEIWDGGKQLPFWQYIKRFKTLRKRQASKRAYLEMTKTAQIDLGLKLIFSIDINNICEQWHGRKSVYRTK
jgi:SAM-dependent methyltransferase